MSTIASDIALCYIVPMTKEKPKPMIVRFYKVHMKAIKEVAKHEKISRAEVVRRAVQDSCVPLREQ